MTRRPAAKPILWTAGRDVGAEDRGEWVQLCADDGCAGGAKLDRASARELRDWLTGWLDNPTAVE